jgi:hypothetical protein
MENKKENEEKKSYTKAQIVTLSIAAAAILIVAIFSVYLLKTRNAPAENTPASTENTTNAESDSNFGQPFEDGTIPATVGETGSVGTDTTVPSTPPTSTTEKKADLYVVKYSFSEDPKSGEEFTVSIKIGNKGTASAGSFHWDWWPTSAGKACDGKVDGLAVGSSKTVECQYTYASWSTYSTKAVVDSKDEVDELDEDNNIATKKVIPIHDEAKADLYISDYSFNHPPKQGEAFTVSITVYNKGDAAAESFWWEWWPTAYGKFCREKIDSLAAHGGRVVTCTYTYGGWANYATKAVADADDDISESDEENNTYTQTVMPIH